MYKVLKLYKKYSVTYAMEKYWVWNENPYLAKEWMNHPNEDLSKYILLCYDQSSLTFDLKINRVI